MALFPVRPLSANRTSDRRQRDEEQEEEDELEPLYGDWALSANTPQDKRERPPLVLFLLAVSPTSTIRVRSFAVEGKLYLRS